MNVALVDRHPIFRTGVRETLMDGIGNLTTFESGGIQYLAVHSQREPLDIIIVGLSDEQPRIDRTALKKAMKNNASASFIVCASQPSNKQARSLLNDGVKGILTKASCPEEVLNCVIEVMNGKNYICIQLRSAVS